MDRDPVGDHALRVPEDYEPALDVRTTERAIKHVKDAFQERLADALSLSRISAPVTVPEKSGLNDELTGDERPVRFEVRGLERRAEIVQSLAKWKRLALAEYGFEEGEGLYTDMNALRPDETLDELHSVYVDQWDWELIIDPARRTVACLREVVRAVHGAIVGTERDVRAAFPSLGDPILPPEPAFVHTEELARRHPELSPSAREDAACREHGAVFLRGIGADLGDGGGAHDDRAADYDDWIAEGEDGRPGLNGDLIVWHPVLGRAVELSSMGIRVSPETLRIQLDLRGETDKAELDFHRRLLAGELPQTVGGGIGQSRLCMVMLDKAHVGEVQASVWPEAMRAACEERGIPLL